MRKRGKGVSAYAQGCPQKRRIKSLFASKKQSPSRYSRAADRHAMHMRDFFCAVMDGLDCKGATSNIHCSTEGNHEGFITGSFGQVKGEKSSAHTYILTRYRV